MNDLPFTIEQVASLLDLLKDARTDGDSYYVVCPFCQEPSKRKTLKIKMDGASGGGVFRCPRCNTSGGTLALYAKLMNCSYSEAFRAIKEKLDIGDKAFVPAHKYFTPKKKPTAPVETRDRFYSALIAAYPLNSAHKENLRTRGLPDEAFSGYGSITSSSKDACKEAARRVIEACSGEEPIGVPGFFKEDGEWSVALHRGIMIPVKNLGGFIQGIQVRRDECKHGPKYVWLSSNPSKERYKDEGTSATSYIHVAVKDMNALLAAPAEKRKAIYLTEGPLKANIANELSGRLFIAIPGVNATQRLPAVLSELFSLGFSVVVNTLDMDRDINPNVASACEQIKRLVTHSGFMWHDYRWDAAYKGIDDYLLAKHSAKKQVG